MKIRKAFYIFLFLLVFSLLNSFSGAYPIYILDEAKNAEAAREMYENASYIVPYFNGELRSDKPVLHYYFMSLGYKLFGVNAYGARFFSAFFGALCLLFSFYTVRKVANERTAFWTLGLLLSSLFFVQEFHLAVPDPYLIFFVTASLWSIFLFDQTHQSKWLFAAYTLTGLGILSKGPIALVIPVGAMGIYLLWSKRFSWKTIKSFRPLAGIFWSVLIAFPWFYFVHKETAGAFTEGFFLDHNISRFSAEKEGHGGLFIITWLFALLGLFPGGLVLFKSFRFAKNESSKNDLLRFSVSCALIVIGIFSFSSTKLPNYTLPAVPFMAVIAALYLNTKEAFNSPKKWTAVFGFLLLITIALPIVGYLALAQEESLSELKSLAYYLGILPVVSLVALVLHLKKNTFKAVQMTAMGWVFMYLILFGHIYPQLTAFSPVEKAKSILHNKENIIVFSRMDAAFPVNYQRVYPVVKEYNELEQWIIEHPDGLILTNTRDREQLKFLEEHYLKIFEQKALFENHRTRIFELK